LNSKVIRLLDLNTIILKISVKQYENMCGRRSQRNCAKHDDAEDFKETAQSTSLENLKIIWKTSTKTCAAKDFNKKCENTCLKDLNKPVQKHVWLKISEKLRKTTCLEKLKKQSKNLLNHAEL